MIQLETFSGEIYKKIWLNENDSKYGDITKYVKKPDYPEYNPNKLEERTIYVETDIKLFNKGQLINFDDDISFDKEDSVLNIYIKSEYVCYDLFHRLNRFTDENYEATLVHLIKQYGMMIKCISGVQPYELCKLAVQIDGMSILHVKEQTEELCKIAVQTFGLSLINVKEQTEEICRLAVIRNCAALDYVKNQTEELCRIAVQKNIDALEMKHLFM